MGKLDTFVGRLTAEETADLFRLTWHTLEEQILYDLLNELVTEEQRAELMTTWEQL